MEIILNEQKLDIQLENEKTVGEVLGGIQLECEKEQMTVIEIKQDGQALNTEAIDTLFELPVDTPSTIELTAASGAEIRAYVKNLAQPFADYAEQIEALPMRLQEGEDAQVIEELSQFSLRLQELYRSFMFSELTELSLDDDVNGKSFAELQKEISAFLTELVTALEEKDTVAASDIAEYELSPLDKELANALSSTK